MKYSLRSLMVVVTLFCVGLGLRIEYLRQLAAFHEQEANRYAMQMKKETGWNPREPGFVPYRPPALLLAQVRAHEVLAEEYRSAASCPWKAIASPPPPLDEREMQEQEAKWA